ncbi:hypothetical protein OIO90_005546 [Microbotryomycetes sp. JL221]|nr:hypothetical protein OIO90_005546 [Microbotryomycetes sp. JL221]
MPHKRRKRSAREAASAALGFDNPPTAKDSLLPIASSSQVESSVKEIKAKRPIGVLAPDRLQASDADNASNKSNKRRNKRTSPGTSLGVDSGVSKNLSRILNAGIVRQEYHAKKKQRLQESESGSTNKTKTQQQALKPLPYESLSAFNRRVEQTLRPDITSAIRHSTQKHQKDKNNKKKTNGDADDDEIDSDEVDKEFKETTTKRGKVKARPTPEQSVDPHARKSKDATSTGNSKQKLYVPPPRRDGTARMTEFEEASLRRDVRDVVDAPPTSLPRPGRKGKGALPISSAEDPVGHSRLPISGALKEQMEQERARAIAQYRALKNSQKQQ